VTTTTVRQILCASDLSPASEPAWVMAQRLGRLLDAEVLLLHVIPPVPIPMEGYFPPRLYQELVTGAGSEAEARLTAVVAAVAGAPLKVRSRVVEGSPAARIVDVAAEEGADLVVVGTHGRTGLDRAFIGSVADRVLRTAKCPVLTVQALPVGTTPTTGLGRILYATDFSPAARAAWPWVLTLASASGAAVDLLHVAAQPVPDRHLSPETLGQMATLLKDQAQVEAERFLQDAGRTWPGRLPRERVTVLVGHGVMGEQVSRWARQRQADLIVMGTQGWSGLLRWMLGSVAQHVIQTAPCPVLTVAPKAAGKEPTHAG
jgi:nucleotide-binding universal stress UspA family protein